MIDIYCSKNTKKEGGEVENSTQNGKQDSGSWQSEYGHDSGS